MDKNDIPDFELPPIDDRYADIPITADSLINLNEDEPEEAAKPSAEPIEADKPPITDMDNAPVEPPPKENYKSAGRRKHIAREKAMESYLNKSRKKAEDRTAYERSLDFFYERAEEERKMARKGFSRTCAAGTVFIVGVIALMLFNFNKDMFTIAVAEILLAWTFIRSSNLGRRCVMASCIINIGICLKQIYEMYDFSFAFNDPVFQGNRLIRAFDLIFILFFLGELLVIKFNKYIQQYCLREVGMTDEYFDEEEL